MMFLRQVESGGWYRDELGVYMLDCPPHSQTSPYSTSFKVIELDGSPATDATISNVAKLPTVAGNHAVQVPFAAAVRCTVSAPAAVAAVCAGWVVVKTTLVPGGANPHTTALEGACCNTMSFPSVLANRNSGGLGCGGRGGGGGGGAGGVAEHQPKQFGSSYL